MIKTLKECIEQFKFYSAMYCDSVSNHEKHAAEFYLERLFNLQFYASVTYNVDLNDDEILELEKMFYEKFNT